MTEWSGPAEVVFAKDLKGRDKVFLPEDPQLFGAMGHRSFTAFNHPRVVMDDFLHTGAMLGMLARRLGVRRSMVSWNYVVQVQEEWEGGLADIERRALIEVVRENGAQHVLLVTGSRDLTPPEVLRLAQRRNVPIGEALALEANASSHGF